MSKDTRRQRRVMIKKERLLNDFLEMAKIPSLSLHERQMGDYLLKSLKNLGLEVHEDGAGKINNGNCGNIIGVLRAPGKKKLLFSSHMATVVPCEKITPIVKDGKITSDGTSVLGGDDKSGIAAVLEAIKVIKENKMDHPEIIVVFSIGEEIGLLGSKAFDIDKYSPDYGFILDSNGKPGEVIVQAPYAATGELKIIGKPAHAGLNPEDGISAIFVAALAITQIKHGRIDKETTSNIGVINGGQAGNIVMPEVTLKYEARSFSEEKLEKILKETNDIFQKTADDNGAKFINTVKKEYSGFHIRSGSEVLNKIEEACKKLGFKYEEHSTGGGSDANIYNGKGYTCLDMATGMSNIHTTDEFIMEEDIYNTARLVLEIIKGFNI